MDLGDYLRVIRAFWRSVVAFLLLGALAGAGLTLSDTPLYQASVRLFVSAQSGPTDINQAYAGGLFTQQRVKSYADIVTSESVMNAVVKDLHLSISNGALAAKISATAPVDTVLINVSVTDTDPKQAQTIANSVGGRFATFVNQLETPVSGQGSTVKVSVVQPAALPSTPISPRPKLNLALGLIVGLALGLGQALLRAILDTTVKDAHDVEVLLDAPIVGLIPFDPDASGHPVITEVSPHSLRAEAFRQLRTNLQFIDVDHAPKSIVITSSVPKEGKSTSSANLAITMARAGLKVIIVEADLRKPRLMNYLGIQGAHVGLTDILIGRTSLDDAMVRNGPSGVAFLPSGTPPPNPSELLASAAMQRLIAELESKFDVVLIDAPPLLPVTDAAVVSSLADGVLLVVRAGSTKREQVTRSKELLAGVDARVLGIVLNRVDRSSKDAYGYYYYSSSGKEGRTRRGSKAPDTFTPATIVPAKPERRGKPETATEQTGPVSVVTSVSPNGAGVPPGPLQAPPSPVYRPGAGAEARADSLREAVRQAFSRAGDRPNP